MVKDGLYWADLLRSKKISYIELADLIEQKVKQLNPSLNALVSFDKKAALDRYQQKKAWDERLFAGLPLPLKMLGQDKKGWQATSASRLLKENRAQTTTNFVRALEKNGLIAIGQSNSPEFGFKNVTDSLLYGNSCNPWNIAYFSGGSSGGAASAVASGMFPIAAASDGGGSIRIPASFSGLIGLKPTRGTMPLGPDGFRGWQGASIAFALTVSMRDTQALFYAMRGTETAAPYQAPKVEWDHPQKISAKKLKVAFTTTSPVGSDVSEDAQLAVLQAAEFLSKQGHTIKEIKLPVKGIELMQSYYQMNGAETAAMMADISQKLKRPIVKEDMELMSWALYQYGKKQRAASYIHALNVWDQAAVEMENLMTDFDLILTPTTAHHAPKISDDLQSEDIRKELNKIESYSEKAAATLIYQMFEKSLRLSPFTQLANLTGQPAISLPTYLTQDGLPLGIQFMAAKGREDRLFQIGKLFEEQHQFCLPPAYKKE